MSFCPQCGKPVVPTNRFCGNCGTAIAEISEPIVPAEPVITVPAVQLGQPPVASAKSKVLGFVGMGLSIGGLFFAILGLICTLVFMNLVKGASLVYALYFGFFSFPLSIVGGILSNNSMAMGNYSAACSVGTKLRTAGIIVSAVMLFFGIVSLAA